MKIQAIRTALVILVALVVCFGGCAALPAGPSLEEQKAQAQQLVDVLGAAKSQIADLKTQSDAVKAAAVAASQPVVAGDHRQDADATVVKTSQAVIAGVGKIDEALTKAQQATEGLNAVAVQYQAQIAAAKTAEDQRIATLNATIQAAQTVGTIAAPQYSPWFVLAGTLASALVAGFAVHKSGQATQTAITTPGTTEKT